MTTIPMPPSLSAQEGALLDRLRVLVGLDPRDAMRAFSEAGREIARLRREEARILGELAAYRAQFTGGMTHYEHERSQILASIVEERRRALLAGGEKPVESALDSYARSQEEYRNWLDQKFVERREMFALEAELAQVHADLELARLQKEEALQATRLNEELVRFARAEMGMS